MTFNPVICAAQVVKSGQKNGPKPVHQHHVVPGLSRTDKGFNLMADLTPTPTSVYRYYDSEGVLLYVGITSRGISRNVEHNGTQSWWPYVTKQEVDHYPDRAAALDAERKLIRNRRPPFNKQHNPDHGRLAAAYENFRILNGPGVLTPGQIMDRNKGRLRMDVTSIEGDLLQCVSCKEDLPLSARINISADRFSFFEMPDGLIGEVVGVSRENYLVQMILAGSWLNEAHGIRALIDKKKIGMFIRTLEVKTADGEWVRAKPKRVSRTGVMRTTHDG